MSSRRSAVLSALACVVSALTMLFAGRAMAGGPGSPSSPPAHGALIVTVVGEDGKPVAGARVEVRTPTRVVATGLTDRYGKYFDLRLRPGDYGVAAGKLGVGRGHAPVVITAGDRTKVTITLQK